MEQLGKNNFLQLSLLLFSQVVLCSGQQDMSGSLYSSLAAWLQELWLVVAPGGKLHPTVFLENRGHLVVECILLAFITYLLRQPRFKPRKEEAPLTEKEIDELCQEWRPEPLVPKVAPSKLRQIVAESAVGPHLSVDGRKCLNLVSMDFLGLSQAESIRDQCQTTIEKYGVGSCGPRGFYGTVDVHLQLERELAAFMKTDDAIIYSFDMATASSVLPAFANRRDVVVCDEAANFSLQNGCNLSRARVEMFKHNDMEDLENILKKIEAENAAEKKPLNRRFIVVEGIYQYFGDLAKLDKIYELKEKYKYRLMVDESIAFGVLGENGRGACEHFGLTPGSVEIIVASMSNSLASIGGFCVGDWEIVDHQRLSGLGYCYSASLPPYLASAASAALSKLASDPGVKLKCQSNAQFVRKKLQSAPGIQVIGEELDSISPLVLVTLADSAVGGKEDILYDIVNMLRDKSILVTLVEGTPLDWKPWGPFIQVVVTAAHSEACLLEFANEFETTACSIMQKHGGKAQ